MTAQNQRTGILLMIATTLIFAIQDGISRHLSESYMQGWALNAEAVRVALSHLGAPADPTPSQTGRTDR